MHSLKISVTGFKENQSTSFSEHVYIHIIPGGAKRMVGFDCRSTSGGVKSWGKGRLRLPEEKSQVTVSL